MKKYRSQNFRLFYDDCETKLLELLYDYNMSFAELGRIVGCEGFKISGLAYGYLSPIISAGVDKGLVKPEVEKICNYFHLDISEVFPRHFCNLYDARMKNAVEVPDYDSYSYKISEGDYCENRVFLKQILNILDDLECDPIMKSKLNGDDKKNIFYSHIIEGCTLQILADKYELTKERIRHICSEIGYKLRRKISRNMSRVLFKETEVRKYPTKTERLKRRKKAKKEKVKVVILKKDCQITDGNSIFTVKLGDKCLFRSNKEAVWIVSELLEAYYVKQNTDESIDSKYVGHFKSIRGVSLYCRPIPSKDDEKFKYGLLRNKYGDRVHCFVEANQ